MSKICPKCGNTHEKNGIFCSRKCSNSRGPRTDEFKEKIRSKLVGKESPIKGRLLKQRISIPCFVCGTELKITKSELNQRKNPTCGSVQCKKIACSKAGKVSAEKRVVRSKDEIELYNLCVDRFSDVRHNYVIADGWDADIVLYNNKIAILWNGPWHYKEMNISNHSLIQVQTRDNIKTSLFRNLGWKVYTFNDCDYTPQSAFDELVLGVGIEPTRSFENPL